MSPCNRWFFIRRSRSLLLLFFCLGGSAPGEEYLSPTEVIPHPSGESVFVVLHTANRVVRLDLASASVMTEYPIGYRPTGAAVSPDGGRLYITDDQPDGSAWGFEVESGIPTVRIEAGHSPTSPVLLEQGKTLAVCNRFDNSIAFIDLESEKILSTVAVAREPIAAAAGPDGRFLVVANHLPVGPANTGFIAAEITILHVATKSVVGSVTLPNGATSLRDLCISPDGRFAYVTHILARYHLPATQLDRGWMNTNAVSIIDIENRTLLNTFLLDNVDLGAANPWGIECTPDGALLVVAHSGCHEVSVIDRTALHEKLAKSPQSDQAPNDLAFLVGIRERIRLSGLGPRGVAVVGRRVLAAEYFSDSIASIDLDSRKRPRAESVEFGRGAPMDIHRRGEFLFHDASICFQQWQSCATCHPDARTDALNWDLLNDGMGSPKNTKNMLLAHQTPPTSMTAARENAEISVRSGFRYIEFTVLPEEDAQAVDEYLKALEPTPSPFLIQGELSEAAGRGEAVFRKANCVRCHPSPLFTDLKRYDVGTGKGNEQGMLFDTPTLVESWRTAPYLYDGSAPTMKDVFTQHVGAERLTAQEIDDLVEYILSL